MREIIKLQFKKISGDDYNLEEYGDIDLYDSENLEKIRKYILPIVAENEGWGSLDLTTDNFNNDPKQYQSVINATLFDNVHVALEEEGKPAGLLEFMGENILESKNERALNLQNLLADTSKWEELISQFKIDRNFLNDSLDLIKQEFKAKKVYSEIGIVIRPDLQGKKSGIVQDLYAIINDGIVFGWTSNPQIVAIRRKLFLHNTYLPIENNINDLNDLISLALVYSDLLTYKENRWRTYKFGVLRSKYFVEDRGAEMIELAKGFAEKGKITEADSKRIEYILSNKSTAGAIISFN